MCRRYLVWLWPLLDNRLRRKLEWTLMGRWWYCGRWCWWKLRCQKLILIVKIPVGIACDAMILVGTCHDG